LEEAKPGYVQKDSTLSLRKLISLPADFGFMPMLRIQQKTCVWNVKAAAILTYAKRIAM
jgi:hypothetical protein